jgi:3'(2'), 5'-bisphosphate nucleotidase
MSTTLDLNSLGKAALALAVEAGAAILEIYSSDFSISHKADHSPLTEADLCANRLLLAGLRSLTPDIPVLSEESSDLALAERQRWTRHWLVDPLDGTREFVSRNGEFTVNIALIEDSRPILGVVHVPVQRRSYAGARGSDATLVTPEGMRAVRVAKPAHQPPRVVGSRSHRGDSLDAYLAILGPHTFVGVGSALKFCVVAEGSADFYPRFGPTSQWDTAAGQAVVEAAGGVVLDTEGQSLRYPTRADYLNPHFVVIGDTSRHWPSAQGH